MDVNGYDDSSMEQSKGFWNLQPLSGGVYFSAIRDAPGAYFNGDITYNRFLLNKGNAFDISTGIFKAPITGIYEFKFSGQQAGGRGGNLSGGTSLYIYVMRNGNLEFDIIDTSSKSDSIDHNIAFTFQLYVSTNDEIKLTVADDDWLWTGTGPDGRYRTYFSGELLFTE